MCTEVILPHNIQGISVDLWGTLFYVRHYINKLNADRIVLLENIFKTNKIDFDTSAETLLLKERRRFREYEKMANF